MEHKFVISLSLAFLWMGLIAIESTEVKTLLDGGADSFGYVLYLFCRLVLWVSAFLGESFL